MPAKKAAKAKPDKKPEKRKPGRPTDYTDELAAAICDAISEGRTLTKICRPKKMPSRVTVWRWTEANEEFRNALARAREAQAWAWADEAVDLADTAIRKATGMPGTGEAGARVAAVKLQVDTRRWLVSKTNARQFGAKVAAELSGPGGKPMEVHQTGEMELSEEQLARIAEASRIAAALEPPGCLAGDEPENDSDEGSEDE